MPYISSTASWYSIFLCSRSCTAESARICQSGGLWDVLAQVAGGIDNARQLVDLPLGAPRAVGRQPAVLGQYRPHVAQHAVLHVLGQFGVVGEQHLAVRLEQRDIALGGRHAGVAVERDAVGAQHMVVLPGLDMALGDHQRILAIVLHRIGGEGDRLISRGRLMRTGVVRAHAVAPARFPAARNAKQHARSQDAGMLHASELTRASAMLNRLPYAAATRPQPSCLRPPAPRRQAPTGRAPDWPNSSAILETRNNAKPVATPLAIIFATPPRRAGRIENPARDQGHRRRTAAAGPAAPESAAGGGWKRIPSDRAAR